VTLPTPSAQAEPYRAVVLGATGAVGGALMRELFASPLCICVTAIVRRETPELMTIPGARGKLITILANLGRLEHDTRAALSFALPHRLAFCTMGVGQPRKVSAEEHRRVDVEYVAAFARACRESKVHHFSLLSAVGANSRSRSRYIRVKGDAEAAVRALGFPRTSLFRPSVLVTPEIRYGTQDRITQWLMPRVSRFLPSRFHEIHVDALARAMRINADREPTRPVEILEYDDVVRLLHSDPQR
jgi:uncharacterized protein YbjT (DUF2867 family)